MKNILPFFLLAALAFVSACAKPLESLEPQASKAADQITCDDAQSALFDVAYASLIDLKTIPQKSELVALFEKVIAEKQLPIQSDLILKIVEDFYQVILNQSATDTQSLLQKVAAAEIGSRVDAEAEQVQKDLANIQTQWKKIVAESGASCPRNGEVANTTTTTVGTRTNHPIVSGANKTLGVAYQSCEAVRKPAMTAATPNLQGISIVGTHPDGVGRKRVVGDLPALLRTDYYLKDFQLAANCKDVRKSPLIYDYGGKPNTPSSGTSMDLFTNAGDGTTVLGIDCSGYVFTSIATAGLKLDPAKKLKPVLVHGINAVMYKEPVQNGMPCFDKISVGTVGTLKAGDIGAKSGHIVIVESVGEDPLGISKATTEAQCNAITAKNFDFVVAQSSPSKEGVGINKYVAKDYLQESEGMKVGFEKYAREACKAKLKNTNVILSGQEVQVIRHKMTAACMDQPIQLVGEACVSSCSASF